MTKEEVEKLKKIPGEAIGAGFTEDIKFILDQKGEGGLAKIEEAMTELGCPKYREIKNFEWYPIGYYIISLLLAKELFSWDDEMIRKMGRAALKISFISKILMKYFISPQRCFEAANDYWKMFYTVGRIEAVEIREDERYSLLQVKDFSGHPIFYRYLEGAMAQIVSFMVKNAECREIEHSLREDGKEPFFKITWEK